MSRHCSHAATRRGAPRRTALAAAALLPLASMGVSSSASAEVNLFGPRTAYAVGGGPEAVVIDDFNGDGRLDLATANNDSNNVSVMVGLASGGFGAKTDYGAGGKPRAVAVGDW